MSIPLSSVRSSGGAYEVLPLRNAKSSIRLAVSLLMLIARVLILSAMVDHMVAKKPVALKEGAPPLRL